jgi:hypothetical protein
VKICRWAAARDGVDVGCRMQQRTRRRRRSFDRCPGGDGRRDDSRHDAAPTTTIGGRDLGRTVGRLPGHRPTALRSTANGNEHGCDRSIAVYEFAPGAISQPDPMRTPCAQRHALVVDVVRRSDDMTHFVAFTHGKFRGARIAFHSVPTWHSDGTLVQPLDSVGDPARRGESAGCLRVLPDDAVRVWDWLAVGDEVHVVN